MKSRISHRDMKLLSLYLDDQLNPLERRRLIDRLEKEPGLRAILEDLQKVRWMLRKTPRLHAPRRFVIAPSQVPARPRREFTPALGFVSAIASLILVMILAGDLLGLFLPRPVAQLSAPVAPEAAAIEPTSQAQVMSTEGSAVPPGAANPALDKSSDQSGISAKSAASTETPGLNFRASVPVSETVTATGTLMLEMSRPAAELKSAQPELYASPTPGLTATPPASKIARSSPGGKEDEEVYIPMIGNPSEEMPAASKQEKIFNANQFYRWLLWIIEGLLALIALIAGGLAVMARRKPNRVAKR